MKELKFSEHAVMRLCLHGEHAEAHKEQVKDVSVSNVRQHKEGEGEERMMLLRLEQSHMHDALEARAVTHALVRSSPSPSLC